MSLIDELNRPEITLLHHTPLPVCSHAIRTCWSSFDRSDGGGDVDRDLIHRVGNEYRHKSTLEHIVYSFYIRGISRSVLQELARHRIASLSVKSSRYTLRGLRSEHSFVDVRFMAFVHFRVSIGERKCSADAQGPTMESFGEYLRRISAYIYMSPDIEILGLQIQNLESLRKTLSRGVTSDVAKYLMHECYKTELTYTINARSLQNVLELRTSKHALREIRILARCIYEALPEDHKYLFHDCVSEDVPPGL